MHGSNYVEEHLHGRVSNEAQYLVKDYLHSLHPPVIHALAEVVSLIWFMIHLGVVV